MRAFAEVVLGLRFNAGSRGLTDCVPEASDPLTGVFEGERGSERPELALSS